MLHFGTIFLVLSISSIVQSDDTCGTRTVARQPLVHFGYRSLPGQWPWHAALFHRSHGSFFQYACGGTIVSSSYVITAAHCTYPADQVRPLTSSEMQVRMGITNIRGGEHSLQQERIVRIERHEEFSTGTLESDIALLKLAAELEITDYVRPICLWEGNDAESLIVGKNGYVTGWGKDENDKLPDSLKHAAMPIVSRRTCSDSDPNYYPRYLFDRKTFCAGNRNGTSAGPGDSGGGLVIEVDGRWMLRGVVSNGKVNSNLGLDTSNFIVFTDVAYFSDWIRTKMELPVENVGRLADKYAACGNRPRPSFVRDKVKQYRQWPWEGHLRKVDDPSDNLCGVVIINEHFVLAPADRVVDRYFSNHSLLEVVFYLDDGETLSTHQIESLVRHENYKNSNHMNNLVLLQLMEMLDFSYFLQPICLWSFDFGATSGRRYLTIESEYEIQESCGSIIRHPHADCYIVEETAVFLETMNQNLPDFEVTELSGKMYLRGVQVDSASSGGAFILAFANISYLGNWIETNAVRSSTELSLLGNCQQNLRRDSAMIYGVTTTLSEYYRCYATFVTQMLVITTATCVTGVPLNSLLVRQRHQMDIKMKTIHLHPSFDGTQLTNNIAIAELAEPFPYAQPYCLPKHAEKLSSLQLEIPTAEGAVALTDTEQCAARWLRENIQVQTNGSHICARIEFPSMTLDCRRELTGLPLIYQYPNKEEWYVRGLLDIGKTNNCQQDGLSYVFIDLTFYADWIKDIAAKTVRSV